MSDDVCPTCHNEGTVERLATPDEVDEGCELGIAYDPCPNDAHHFAAPVERVTAIAGDGVRTRPVSPGCPICTGGRGVPCSWHAT